MMRGLFCRDIFVVGKCFNNIKVQRITVCTRFFCSVEDADALHCFRKDSTEVLHAEWTIEVNCHEAEFLACFVLLVDDGLDDVVD